MGCVCCVCVWLSGILGAGERIRGGGGGMGRKAEVAVCCSYQGAQVSKSIAILGIAWREGSWDEARIGNWRGRVLELISIIVLIWICHSTHRESRSRLFSRCNWPLDRQRRLRD